MDEKQNNIIPLLQQGYILVRRPMKSSVLKMETGTKYCVPLMHKDNFDDRKMYCFDSLDEFKKIESIWEDKWLKMNDISLSEVMARMDKKTIKDYTITIKIGKEEAREDVVGVSGKNSNVHAV